MEKKYSWNQVKDLTEYSLYPDRYDIEEKLLYRSPLLMINHLHWNQLIDYKFYNQINNSGETIITVHSYYTAAIYNLRRLKTVEIPANEPFNQTIVLNNHSAIRQSSVKQARLESCFDPNNSTEIKNYIKDLHNIKNLEEYCPAELETIEITGDNSVEPYDRVWVAWAIDLVVAIYREDIEGNINLVGCSDYLVDLNTMIYPKSNNYWVDRKKKEMKDGKVQLEDYYKGLIKPYNIKLTNQLLVNQLSEDDYNNWLNIVNKL